MENRRFVRVMVLTWAALLGLVIPMAHANGTEDYTKKMAKRLTPSAQRLLVSARNFMDKKENSRAIDLIRADTKRQPPTSGSSTAACTHPLVCLALGNSYLMIPDYPHAESAYLAALALAPDFLDARINLAKVYSDTSRFDKAAQAFLTAYELSHPGQADYLYYSAVMALANGRAQTAIRHFERLFAAHPDQVTRQWKENFANALMTAGQWKRALPLVRELAARGTGKEKIRWQETLLQIYLQTNDLKQALSYATGLSRQDCTVARWWKALVHIQLSLGHYSRALDDLIVYGFLSPLTQEEKKLFADLSLQLEIPARAVHMYESILAETRDNEVDAKGKKQMIQRLVAAYRQLGKSDQALALLDRFDPNASDPELLLLKGDLLYEAKAFESANKAYCRAARSDCPRKGQAWLMAGYAAWQHNDMNASRSAFEKAARFKRHRKDAMAAMAQLERTTQM